MNANYTSPGDGTGLSGSENNPLLVGPVTFEFTATGHTSIPMINGVSFDFGTRPSVIPEPAPLALLGVGLVAGWIARRRANG